MSSWSMFLTYTLWAIESLLYGPSLFITLALVIQFIIALIMQKPFGRGARRAIHWFSLASFVLFPLVTAVGVAGSRPHGAAIQRWAVYTVAFLFCTSLFWAIVVVWKMKGFRWFAVSASLLALWLGLGGLFIAGMSISGDWL